MVQIFKLIMASKKIPFLIKNVCIVIGGF